MENSQWTDTLVQLLSLALRLESEGQYNIAKICRAQADCNLPPRRVGIEPAQR